MHITAMVMGIRATIAAAITETVAMAIHTVIITRSETRAHICVVNACRLIYLS